MRRYLRLAVLPLVAVAAFLTIVVGSAAADPTTLTLPPEPVELTVPGVTYQTALPALGETLADPLAVTDDELASVGVQSLTVPLSLGPVDFVVDDDLAQCPDADFTTSTGIQQAIAFAPPGSHIRVCPGLYAPITVPKTLTIEASLQQGQATECKESPVLDLTKDAVIDAGATNVIAVNLQANGIVLSGFIVQNTDGNPGIYASPAFSGYQILFNVVQQNTFGLYLNANGVSETVVERNCFRLNNRPGAASGAGIYSDQGLSNATVQENHFFGQESASMIYTLNAHDFRVLHNDVIDDNTIVLVDTHNALVEYNHVVRTGGSGIFVGGGVTATTIRYNLIESPGGTGITTNILFVAAPNEVAIEKNHVVGSPFDGIRLDDTVNSAVSGNKSERNVRDGIRLRMNADNNFVQNNLSRDNGRDGMRVDSAGASGNTIQQNKMLGNTEHDCHDDTVGPGTAGTANFWIKDIGKTENKPGLCKNATP